MIAHIKIDPHFRKELREALNKAVTDPKHKAVIPDLLDEEAFHEAMRAAAKKADEEDKEALTRRAPRPLMKLTKPAKRRRAQAKQR